MLFLAMYTFVIVTMRVDSVTLSLPQNTKLKRRVADLTHTSNESTRHTTTPAVRTDTQTQSRGLPKCIYIYIFDLDIDELRNNLHLIIPASALNSRDCGDTLALTAQSSFRSAHSSVVMFYITFAIRTRC